MAPKKLKKNSKSPGVTGTKPKTSQPSLQLPSTSASEMPMIPNPVLKAEKKALKKKDRLKRKTITKVAVPRLGLASTVPGIFIEDEPVIINQPGMDFQSIADMETNSISAAVAASLSGCCNKTSSEESFKSISTVSSLISPESSELMDVNLPTVYKNKRLFFHVYSNETYSASHTAHDLVKSLIAAINESPPTGLFSFHDIFKIRHESDYLFYLTEFLVGNYIPEKPEMVVVGLLENLKYFVNFVKETYLEQRLMRHHSVEYFINMLKKEELSRRHELIEIMENKNFPAKGMVLFNISTHFYLLLIQEILSLKDLTTCEESMSFIKEVTNLLKSCAEFCLRFFNIHWKARLEDISYVSLQRTSLAGKKEKLTKKQKSCNHFQLSAIMMDSYLLTKDPISLCQTECSNESIETKIHQLLAFSNSLRDDYIIEKNIELQKSMYFPVESAAAWMKAAVKLSNLQTAEQKVCLTVLHRHHLEPLEPNGKAVFTLKPQVDPVVFHFEKYSNLEVSFGIKRSCIDGLRGYIKPLPKASYLWTCCHVNREDGEKTTLMEIACVPEYMVDMLGKNEYKFIEKSFRANIDSRSKHYNCSFIQSNFLEYYQCL